jgi:hypothetical protein
VAFAHLCRGGHRPTSRLFGSAWAASRVTGGHVDRLVLTVGPRTRRARHLVDLQAECGRHMNGRGSVGQSLRPGRSSRGHRPVGRCPSADRRGERVGAEPAGRFGFADAEAGVDQRGEVCFVACERVAALRCAGQVGGWACVGSCTGSEPPIPITAPAMVLDHRPRRPRLTFVSQTVRTGADWGPCLGLLPRSKAQQRLAGGLLAHWGSRGRRFKSCRPDGAMGSIPRSGP